jgi:hypothetical protein
MTGDQEGAPTWSIDAPDDGQFWRFYNKLQDMDKAIVQAALDHVLEVRGIDICSSEWGKSLGAGLYEFRIRVSLDAILGAFGSDDAARAVPVKWRGRSCLLRIFCTFHGERIVLLLGGYNKGKDPSAKRQRKEIERARRELSRWKKGTRR